MGNGMTMRFNKTLLNMMTSLPETKKANWKAHVSTLTPEYNATVLDSTVIYLTTQCLDSI